MAHKNLLALQQLKPEAGFSWKDPDDYSTLKYYSNADDKPTETEITEQAVISESIFALELLRSVRNYKLAASDWMGLSDVGISEEWTKYRQALRDLPSNASPTVDEEGKLSGVVFPEEPKQY